MPVKHPASKHHMDAAERHHEAAKHHHVAAIHHEAGDHEKAKEHSTKVVMPPTSTARKVTKNLTSDTIVVACKGTSDAMARLNRANSL